MPEPVYQAYVFNPREHEEEINQVISFVEGLSKGNPGLAMGLLQLAQEVLTESFEMKSVRVPRGGQVGKVGSA